LRGEAVCEVLDGPRAKRIWVHRHVDKETGIREEGTKEDAGAWVTMPTIVADALRAHTAEYRSDEWVFNSLGKPYTASRIDKAWRAACKRAGISGVRFHDLRHAAASLMITAGWNIKRVQTEMRHADPAFTIRVYGHLFPPTTAATELDSTKHSAQR
jgi:integrase